MHVEWYELLAICVTCVLLGALHVHLLHVRPLMATLRDSTKAMNEARRVMVCLRAYNSTLKDQVKRQVTR